jgi:preprotein translocase subunit SecE
METQTKKHVSPVQYLRESKAELQKVTWPSRKDTARYSIIVVVASVLIALFFALSDWILSIGFDQLVKLFS